ncbi:hypothetical protein DL766_000361 [Monosporascus sp. MC13-8B]|uniref:FAD linked oxidase N-terminal domain-containing protein n=1 Tax=Monosporascus cannonballus TaxID=155416 RepID=A0ABY0HFN7_9PEZI|nr:hypothetical protein DL762_001671 [Monosporascus cannonballus]RYO99979.1 hypothetical protein DL763_001110 [Monosporascus cannonballus]RYP39539.1 hypothetical protein DL766_000361 [Monosporascus sp. MC13-8B]
MNSQKAIDALQGVLPPSQFALKGTGKYETLNTETYQSGLNTDLLPACIFQPKSAKDVSIFVQTIKPFVLSGDTAFAVVGGGANPPLVIEYEVVLASGDIVNANETSNADLWRALRGGGNNFGIVTRYEMRTFEQGQLYGGSISYQATEFPNQIEALVSELQKPDASHDTHLMMSLGYTAAFGPAPVGMNQTYYTRAVEKPPVLEPFTSLKTQIGDLNTMRMPSLSEAAGEQHGDVPALQRSAYMNVTVKAHVDTLIAGAEI